MDPTAITKEQHAALIRTRIAEKMRDPAGEKVTPEEAHVYANEPVPSYRVYLTLRNYGFIEGMPIRLTDLGRQALAKKRTLCKPGRPER